MCRFCLWHRRGRAVSPASVRPSSAPSPADVSCCPLSLFCCRLPTVRDIEYDNLRHPSCSPPAHPQPTRPDARRPSPVARRPRTKPPTDPCRPRRIELHPPKRINLASQSFPPLSRAPTPHLPTSLSRCAATRLPSSRTKHDRSDGRGIDCLGSLASSLPTPPWPVVSLIHAAPHRLPFRGRVVSLVGWRTPRLASSHGVEESLC